MSKPKQVYCRKCTYYRNEWCDYKFDSPDPDMARDCPYYKSKTKMRMEGEGVKTTIICGFPGVGKSSCQYDKDGNSHSNVWDMESSEYSWIFDSFNPKDYPKRNPSFPKNYIDSLEKLLKYGGYEYIFLSCHDVVRDELRKRGIKYIIVAPKNTPEIKNEYCKRYLKRGSDVDLITKIYQEWDEMLDSIKEDPSPCIWLDSGEYLADVLSKEGE